MIPPRVHPYVLRTWADREMYCVDCIITDGVWHLQPCPKDPDAKLHEAPGDVTLANDPQLCPTCAHWTRWSHGHELCDCDN